MALKIAKWFMWLFVILVALFDLNALLGLISLVAVSRMDTWCGTPYLWAVTSMELTADILLVLTTLALLLFDCCRDTMTRRARVAALVPISIAVIPLICWFTAIPLITRPGEIWAYIWLPLSAAIVTGGFCLFSKRNPANCQSILRRLITRIAAICFTVSLLAFLSSLPSNFRWLSVAAGDDASRVTALLGKPDEDHHWFDGHSPPRKPSRFEYEWRRGLVKLVIELGSDEKDVKPTTVKRKWLEPNYWWDIRTIPSDDPRAAELARTRCVRGDLERLREACWMYTQMEGRGAFPEKLADLRGEHGVTTYRSEDYIYVPHDGKAADVDVDTPLIAETPGRHRKPKAGCVLLVGGNMIYNADDVAGFISKSVSGKGYTLDESLVAASWTGDADKIKSLLDQGAQANARGPNGWTALMKATRRGHTEIVKLLIERGADVNAIKQDVSSLTLAAEKGYLPIVQLLLQHGAIAEPRGKGSWAPYCPLLASASKGYTQVVEALLQHGVSMKTLGAKQAFIQAAYGKHLDIVKLMIAHGADVNAEIDDSFNAMTVAFQAPNPDAVHILISVGADINVKDKEGYTALSYMIGHGNFMTAKELIEHGADVHVKSLRGKSLLESAKKNDFRPFYKDVVELLKKAGVTE